LLYPGLSSRVLGYFWCRDIDGVSYNMSQMTIMCTDHRYLTFLPYAIVMTFVYPIGVPLFFFWLLYRNRNRLDRYETVLSLGFLYEAYSLEVWWFEMADMAHKLFMSSIVVFFPPDAQMPVAIVVTILYTNTLLIKKPYVRWGDDSMHLLTQVEIFIFCVVGNTLRATSDQSLTESVNIALSFVLIGLSTIVVFSFFFVVARYFRKWWFQTLNTLKKQESVEIGTEDSDISWFAASSGGAKEIGKTGKNLTGRHSISSLNVLGAMFRKSMSGRRSSAVSDDGIGPEDINVLGGDDAKKLNTSRDGALDGVEMSEDISWSSPLTPKAAEAESKEQKTQEMAVPPTSPAQHASMGAD